MEGGEGRLGQVYLWVKVWQQWGRGRWQRRRAKGMALEWGMMLMKKMLLPTHPCCYYCRYCCLSQN